MTARVPVNFLETLERTASGQQTLGVIGGFDKLKSAVVQFQVTAITAAAGDTLDVFLLHSVDKGTTWDEFAHFTQVLGNATPPVDHIAAWSGLVTPESELHAAANAGALAVGVRQGPVGSTWAAKWVITGAGAKRFTFGLVGELNR